MTRTTCKTCNAPLSKSAVEKAARGRGRSSGLCRTCWTATVRKPARVCSDCGTKVTARSEKGRCRPCSNRLMAKDAEREAQRIELMRVALQRPEVRARRLRANRLLGYRRLAWCPPERRTEYFKLLKKFGQSHIARAQIEATMTPFERQLARVRQGAAVVPKLVIRPQEHAFTLGGVSAGMV